MKKIISIVCVLALAAGVAFAQQPDEHRKKGNDWREKVRAEQVSFITEQLDLSEAEAQAFWPVYNDVQKQRREAFKNMGEAFKALSEGAEGSNADALLNKYLDEKKASDKIEAEAIARYKKVLPAQKVAKLILAEENFRHRQINKLGRGEGPGPAGNRPGKGGPGGRFPQMNAPSDK